MDVFCNKIYAYKVSELNSTILTVTLGINILDVLSYDEMNTVIFEASNDADFLFRI